MKKLIYILLTLVLLIFGGYYGISVLLNNSGQFTNYYFYPSSSIKSSKDLDIFLNEVPEENILYEGDSVFMSGVKKDILFWFDTSKTEKSFGFLNLFARDIIYDDLRTLRVGFIDDKKRFSTYNNNYHFKFSESNNLETIHTSSGKRFKIGSVAEIVFFNKKNKEKIGTVKIRVG
ncbi:hypothetical protein JMN32_03630 [Fulvivirga sp. 29W222]|uniref:Uncharacterized protein n=1 Tax=Fulvivirga marina TaxID=2494733 RepID=A0A937KB08_9BACT|nr:hypothetical protein [Fulvivirga marina]MBL6445382.1 hypothetical protein [Fulvivirga marina]